jgi:hypothetical protein
MSAIHELSTITPLPELDLFGVPPTQTSVDYDICTEHRPISTLSPDSLIEFNVHTGYDEYIKLSETELYMKIRVDLKKALTGTPDAADWDKVSVVNNLLHSMFKQVDIYIGDKQITLSHQTYAYRAEMETRLGMSPEAKKSRLTACGWEKDDPASPDGINATRSTWITFNPDDSTKIRGKEIELMGKLHLDLAHQERGLIGGTSLLVKLTPNEPAFYLMASNDVRPKVDFMDAALFVHRSKINKMVVDAHLLALNTATAKYPITRSYVIANTINQGTLDAVIDNVHSGQLPRRVFVAFVDNAAFNGSLLKNPFNYKHFDIVFLACFLDGIQFPLKAFQPDFDKQLTVREYMSLFEATNQTGTDSCIDVPWSDYDKGNTIFGFNFAPDLSTGCKGSGHVNPIRRGSLRIQVRFKKALATTINILVYCEFDKIIEIDESRNAILDNS